MREIIIERIIAHWDDSFGDIFDISLEDIDNMSDLQLFNLYNAIFELGI